MTLTHETIDRNFIGINGLLKIKCSSQCSNDLRLNKSYLQKFYTAIEETRNKLLGELKPEDVKVIDNGQVMLTPKSEESKKLVEEWNVFYRESTEDVPELRKINVADIRGDVEGSILENIAEIIAE